MNCKFFVVVDHVLKCFFYKPNSFSKVFIITFYIFFYSAQILVVIVGDSVRKSEGALL